MKNKKQPILIIEYQLLGYIFSLLLRILVLITGFIFLFFNTFFAYLGGTLLIFTSLMSIFLFLTFKKVSFFEEEVVFEKRLLWFRKTISINYEKLVYSRTNGILKGNIMFWEKENKAYTFLFGMIDFLSVKRESIKKLKAVLISKKVFMNDDFAWND